MDADWQPISLARCWGWHEAQITNKYFAGRAGIAPRICW